MLLSYSLCFQVEKLEADNKVLRETGLGGGLFQALPLPGGMAVTSSEVISSLNEHLVVSLQVSHDSSHGGNKGKMGWLITSALIILIYIFLL